MTTENTDESKKRSLANLHPYKPGQSGNPNGRPKNLLPRFIREQTKDGKEIVETVLKVLRTAKSQKIKLMACEFLRDTGWGKPAQAIGLLGAQDAAGLMDWLHGIDEQDDSTSEDPKGA